MRRRGFITSTLAAAAIAAGARAGHAAAPDGLMAAFEAGLDAQLNLGRARQGLARAGWRQVEDAGGLKRAGAVLGDSLSAIPHALPGRPERLTEAYRAKSRANVAASVEGHRTAPFRSETWQLDGKSFVNLRQEPPRGALWCAGATADAELAAAFLAAVWPGDPASWPDEPVLQTRSVERLTPLFSPAMTLTAKVTRFDRAKAEQVLAAPFEAVAGFLIVMNPER